MKPTAKQVAHAADVSLSAVSRAFSPGTSLDEDKRRRILAAAAEIGYVSPARRTAEAIAAGTVSLVTGDLANPFYPMVLEALARRLQSRHLQLLVYALPNNTSVDTAIVPIITARPRAVIVTSAYLTSQMASACRDNGIKIVLLNRIQHDVRVDAVTCDNYAGGRDAAAYLIGKGYQKLGFISGLRMTSTNVERSRGFRDQLTDAGRGVHVEAEGAFNYRVAHDAATSVLSHRRPPDALFCCNDLMALAAIDAAKERGMRIPDDIAIIGFDDIPMAAWNSYNLTTIRQPVDRMVQEAIDLIDGSDAPSVGEGVVRILPGKLTVRASA